MSLDIIGEGGIVVQMPKSISKYSDVRISELVELVDCITRKECLNEILDSVSFLKNIIKGWWNDIEEIKKSKFKGVVQIDLDSLEKKSSGVGFYIKTSSGGWLLVFNGDLRKRNLEKINKVDY